MAVLFILEGVLCVIGTLFGLIASFNIEQSLNIFGSVIGAFINQFMIPLLIFILILGVMEILIGWGLLKLKNWARILALIFSIIYILTIAGIPISIIFIYFLVRKKTKEAFGAV